MGGRLHRTSSSISEAYRLWVFRQLFPPFFPANNFRGDFSSYEVALSVRCKSPLSSANPASSIRREQSTATMSTSSSNTCSTCQKPSGDKKCTACKCTYYCSPECQKTDWVLHKTRCQFLQNHPPGAEPQAISCVKIHSPHTRYEAVEISSDHAVFNTKPLPITAKCGYPLVMFREVEGLQRGPGTDNQVRVLDSWGLLICICNEY